ncbi:MAG: flagellar motor protein MotB [Defluviitaleaceae bacterium]|nr:flagellar motor protein MotB [Defluviitaleaceae bacterium]
MKKGKRQSGAKMVLPGWMASYGDMVTVLMAFFALMFAFSTIDQELFERFVASFNPARADEIMLLDFDGGDLVADVGAGILPDVLPPDPAGAPGDEGGVGEDIPEGVGGREPLGDTVGDMYNTFRMYMADVDPALPNEPHPGDYFVVIPGDNYMLIQFPEHTGDVFFNSGDARLLPAAMYALDYLGLMLRDFAAAGHGIIVEGHTDDRPIATDRFPSNWTLSAARAMAVVEYLTGEWGVDPRMIAGNGRSEYFPIASNDTPEGRAQNRRVEIKVFTVEATAGGAVGTWFTIPGTQ